MTFAANDYFALLQDKDGVDYVKSDDEALIVPLTTRGEILFIREPAPAFDDTALLLPGARSARTSHRRSPPTANCKKRSASRPKR